MSPHRRLDSGKEGSGAAPRCSSPQPQTQGSTLDLPRSWQLQRARPQAEFKYIHNPLQEHLERQENTNSFTRVLLSAEQADLRNITGLVPDHGNKARFKKVSANYGKLYPNCNIDYLIESEKGDKWEQSKNKMEK